jgi:hypothetical protein
MEALAYFFPYNIGNKDFVTTSFHYQNLHRKTRDAFSTANGNWMLQN